MALSFCGKRIFLTRRSLLRSQIRNRYVVLLPEIGEDLPEKNPLLKEETKLPEFNRLTIERCIAAIGKQCIEYEITVSDVESKIKDKQDVDIFKDVLDPLEEVDGPLHITWGIAKLMYFGNHTLMPTKSYFQIHKRATKAYHSKFVSVPIFEACKKALLENQNQYTDEQKKVLSKFILTGKLNGLELKEENKEQFDWSVRKMMAKREEFAQKLQISTLMFKSTVTNPHLMRNFPEDFLKTTATDPSKYLEGPWTITLEPDISSTFLEYCPDRDMRQIIWDALVLRSSLYQDRAVETSSNIQDIRWERSQQAKLLGYKNYAEMSMTTKMAGSLDKVYEVFDSLLEIAYPYQEQEIKDLTIYARERGFDNELTQWDVPFWMRKQKRTLYNITDEALREYFPLPQVLNGLFNLIEELYGVQFVERKNVDVWHQDVQFFDVFETDGSNPELLGSFYLDLYAREDQKKGVDTDNGFALSIINRSRLYETKPLTSLIFNFKPPTKDKPSILTFNQVEKLFQKFGHALQQLLTTVNYSELSGLSNVEWDATGITSNFMGNWVYEPMVLKAISNHYDTNKSLDDEMIQNIRNSRTHMAGYNLCNELYLARFDLELYRDDDLWAYIMRRMYKKHFVIKENKKDSHLCSFIKIFEDWGAAYYSHLWSNMLAADAFSAFQEIPADSKDQQIEIGRRFRHTFFALGGSCSANEVFRRFRGRDPSPKALLKNLGLKPDMSREKLSEIVH